MPQRALAGVRVAVVGTPAEAAIPAAANIVIESAADLPSSSLLATNGFWIAHALRPMTAGYPRQIREDVAFRQKWATEVGLRFHSLAPKLGYIGLKELWQHTFLWAPKLLNEEEVEWRRPERFELPAFWFVAVRWKI